VSLGGGILINSVGETGAGRASDVLETEGIETREGIAGLVAGVESGKTPVATIGAVVPGAAVIDEIREGAAPVDDEAAKAAETGAGATGAGVTGAGITGTGTV
jgi:hypothetical protein